MYNYESSVLLLNLLMQRILEIWCVGRSFALVVTKMDVRMRGLAYLGIFQHKKKGPPQKKKTKKKREVDERVNNVGLKNSKEFQQRPK